MHSRFLALTLSLILLATAGAVLAISTLGMLALGLLPQLLRWVEHAAASGF